MLNALLLKLPVGANFVLFGFAAAMVWIAGFRLAHYADAISDRLRIGKALMGLIFLAAATELPELVTTIGAAIQGNAPLVLNNMFGGIVMQTAVLAVADASVRHATLTFYPRKLTPALEGTLLILLLTLLLCISFLGDINLFSNIGLGAVLLAAAYVWAIALLRTYDSNSGWQPVAIPEEASDLFGAKTGSKLDRISLTNLMWLSAGATFAILVAGVLLVHLADALADQTGLGSSFVGVTLLAAATSLPELSTTISAARLGAYTMAISNIFGSNLIMLALLLPADLFYREGVLLSAVDRSALFALIAGIAGDGCLCFWVVNEEEKTCFGDGARLPDCHFALSG